MLDRAAPRVVGGEEEGCGGDARRVRYVSDLAVRRRSDVKSDIGSDVKSGVRSGVKSDGRVVLCIVPSPLNHIIVCSVQYACGCAVRNASIAPHVLGRVRRLSLLSHTERGAMLFGGAESLFSLSHTPTHSIHSLSQRLTPTARIAPPPLPSLRARGRRRAPPAPFFSLCSHPLDHHLPLSLLLGCLQRRRLAGVPDRL